MTHKMVGPFSSPFCLNLKTKLKKKGQLMILNWRVLLHSILTHYLKLRTQNSIQLQNSSSVTVDEQKVSRMGVESSVEWEQNYQQKASRMGVQSSEEWEQNGSRIISRMRAEWEYNPQQNAGEWEWNYQLNAIQMGVESLVECEYNGQPRSQAVPASSF